MSFCSGWRWSYLTINQAMQGMEMDELQSVHRDADRQALAVGGGLSSFSGGGAEHGRRQH
jgi:hypothetical protein